MALFYDGDLNAICLAACNVPVRHPGIHDFYSVPNAVRKHIQGDDVQVDKKPAEGAAVHDNNIPDVVEAVQDKLQQWERECQWII